MCCVKIGTSQCLEVKKLRATPTKQDLGTCEGFFSKFSMSTLCLKIPLFHLNTNQNKLTVLREINHDQQRKVSGSYNSVLEWDIL